MALLSGGWPVKGFRFILAIGVAGVFAAWFLGQVARDGTVVTALLFYAPSSVVALALASVGLLLWGYARRIAVCSGLLAVPPLAFVLAVENHWTRSPTQTIRGPELTLVHWNVFKGRQGWDRVKAELIREKADLYVLQEVRKSHMTSEEVAESFGPAYTVVKTGATAIVGRGTLSVGPNRMPRQAWVNLVKWKPFGATAESAPISLLVAHLPSDPLVARDPILRELHLLVEEYRPDFVVGDLNAPRRSWRLAYLPEGYAHAYDMVGAGWSYTWPMPIPLLAIDQCIVGPRVEALRYELRASLASDHRLQYLRFRQRSPETMFRKIGPWK